MVSKARIAKNPPLKARDQRSGNLVAEISLAKLPAETVNVVVELLDSDSEQFIARSGLAAPAGALSCSFHLGQQLMVQITVLGQPEELLVQPLPDGFSVKHINSRFTANAPGVTYAYEAYPE